MELYQSIKKWFNQLNQTIYHQNSLSLARRLYFVWIFTNYAILTTTAGFFYSAGNYIPERTSSEISGYKSILNILNIDSLNLLYPYFLVLILLASIVGISERYQRWAAAAVYLLMMNLDNKAHVILDGGNNLIHLIGFYLIFIDTQNLKNSLSITLTNLARLMILIQVCLIYATAGLLKVMGPLWNKGVALYYTMGVPEFGNEKLFQFLSDYPLAVALFTLGTVLFQISFPYLIWNQKLKPFVIAVGTALHLSISFVMGLFMFGFAMCLGYAFFKTDKATQVVI